MKIWSVCNQKGGVGKTTSAVTLAGILAQRGKSVLLVDLDPHGSLSSYFGINPDDTEDTVYSLFQEDANTLSVLANTQQTAFDRISLLPASTGLATLDRKMSTRPGLGLVLHGALQRLRSRFDYVIIDSPPVLGVLMVNALAACERLLVPVQTEFLALKGLERMQRTLEMICQSRDMSLDWMIIPTLYDRRTRASVQTLNALKKEHSTRIWRGVIPVDTRFRDAAKTGAPLSYIDPDARGVQAYMQLLNHMLDAGSTVAAWKAEQAMAV
ncbi:MAG: ParA family protein [Pseudomonadota bacterium]